MKAHAVHDVHDACASKRKYNSGMICLVWEQFGPYHFARLEAMQRATKMRVVGVQISNMTSTYAWDSPVESRVFTLLPGVVAERVRIWTVFWQFRRFLLTNQIQVAFLPSYWPARNLALLIAGCAAGVRLVMMNDSHAGTARATGWKYLVKRFLLRRFHAALVAGEPHRRYFIAIGFRTESVFTGMDAVDNRYFTEKADAYIKEGWPVGLPRRYFLSLGRFVAVKNLRTLIRAYIAACKGNAKPSALVMVGSGDEWESLIEEAEQCGLNLVDARKIDPRSDVIEAHTGAAVYFYGFRQIEENALFYAFADAFVLPSWSETWGLVVNEAMACGLPVVVSHAAGCAEDLVEPDGNGWTFDPANEDELAGRMRQLAYDASLRERMGQRSREIIARWGCDNFARQALLAADCALKGQR